MILTVHTPVQTPVRSPARTVPAPDRGTRSAADRSPELPARGCCGSVPDLAHGRAPGSRDPVPVPGHALGPVPAGTLASAEANVYCAVSCGSSAASGLKNGDMVERVIKEHGVEVDLRELGWRSAWGS